MFALMLCVANESCLALSAARFDPQAATVIVTETASRTTTWRAPATLQSSGRIEIPLSPLLASGFE